MAGIPIRERGAPLRGTRGKHVAVTVVEALLYIAWLGSLIGIAFVAAPAAFAHAPARTAGAIVGASLSALTWFAWLCGGAALVIWLTRIPRYGWIAIVGAFLVAVAIGANDYARWGITPKMDAIVAGVSGSLRDLPNSDPRRAEFDALHRRSTETYGAVMLFGLAAAALAASRR